MGNAVGRTSSSHSYITSEKPLTEDTVAVIDMLTAQYTDSRDDIPPVLR